MERQREFEVARQRMIEHQLRARGITSPRVLEAMIRVPRHRFVPHEMRNDAYTDQALLIDCGQTISQPYIVALMTQALALQGDERVLEIGTGSGYQTAILAELAHQVVTVERHRWLSEQAERVLQQLGYTNVQLIVGDGTQGWSPGAPFDRMIITAAAAACPPHLWEQLDEGGILVGPFGSSREQVLQGIQKINGQPTTRFLTACRFVPLISATTPPSGSGP